MHDPIEAARIAIAPGSAPLGADVTGLDLTRPLNREEIAAVEAALVRHKVLFVRDQRIDTDQHVERACQFGTPDTHPFAGRIGGNVIAEDPDRPELVIVESRADAPTVAEYWHTDVTWSATPPLGSILRMTHMPERGGDTIWADMEAAYEGLDDATRARLSGLVALHDWHGFRRGMRAHGTPEDRIAALEAEFPPAEHPVVRTHPVSGRKGIFVNSSFTTRIKGMAEAESDALLKRLFELPKVPDYQVRFRWSPHAIAFWDNRSTQHFVMPDVSGHRRLERVTIAGDRPF